jgi:hypothetical protein
VVYNRVNNEAFRTKGHLEQTLTAVVTAPHQFNAVTSPGPNKKFLSSADGSYENLSPSDCASLATAIDAMVSIATNGATADYTQFAAAGRRRWEPSSAQRASGRLYANPSCPIRFGGGPALRVGGCSTIPRIPAGSHVPRKPCPPAFATAGQRMFRTVIQEAARRGANFAGHFALAEWGCGTGCVSVAVVDAASGVVYDGPFGRLPRGSIYLGPPPDPELTGLFFHIDSRLLIAAGCPNRENCGTYYYEWVGNQGKRGQTHFSWCVPKTCCAPKNASVPFSLFPLSISPLVRSLAGRPGYRTGICTGGLRAAAPPTTTGWVPAGT